MCLNKHFGRRNGSFSQLLLWIWEKKILETRYVPHHQLVIKTRHTVEHWHDGQLVAWRCWVGGQGKHFGRSSGRLTEKKCDRYQWWLVEGTSFVWGKKLVTWSGLSVFCLLFHENIHNFFFTWIQKGLRHRVCSENTCTKISVWLNKNSPILIWYTNDLFIKYTCGLFKIAKYFPFIPRAACTGFP